jgi:hypothetical protein
MFMRETVSIMVMASLAVVSTPAEAYLDPSTGSMVISAIVGILASVGLALKTYWYRLKSLFRRGSEKKGTASEESS